MTFWGNGNKEQIDILCRAIIDSAFDINGFVNEEKVHIIEINMIQLEQPSIKFDRQRDYNVFVDRYAKILWGHKFRSNPEAGKQLVSELKKQTIFEIKQEISKALKKHDISKTASAMSIKAALPHIKVDLDKKIEKWKKPTRKKKSDYYYFVGVDKNKHSWKEAERHAIQKIECLYDQYTPIKNNQRQIAYSMALVFSAVQFWDDFEPGGDVINTIFERLIKILQKINNLPPISLLDE